MGWLWPFVAFLYLAMRLVGSDGGQPARTTQPAPWPASAAPPPDDLAAAGVVVTQTGDPAAEVGAAAQPAPQSQGGA